MTPLSVLPGLDTVSSQPRRQGAWGSHFIALGVTVFALLTATATVNYFVDVQDIFGRRNAAILASYEDYVARLVRSDQPLPYIMHERALKQELARQTAADCYVFGSSHEMRVSITTYPVALELGCKTVMNIAVSAGTHEDLIILSSIIFSKPSLRAFLAGVSPWALRRNANAMWTEPAGTMPPARKALGLSEREPEENTFTKLRQLINGRYLQANLNHLYEGSGLPRAEPFRNFNPVTHGAFAPDGTYIYAGTHDALAPGTPVPDGSFGIDKPYVDPEVVGELEHIFEVMKKRGIQVAIVLNPYHPQVWRCVAPSICEAMRAVEAEMHRLAQRLKLRVIGSYDPAMFGLTETDFRDESHLTKDSLRRVHFAKGF